MVDVRLEGISIFGCSRGEVPPLLEMMGHADVEEILPGASNS
jgi:hypothetical protein